jgi:uncharacterized membrane protein
MRADASSYMSADLQSRFRTQAYRVWFVTSVVLLFWILLIIAAPLFHVGGIYSFFSYICHQIPERSLHVAGEQFAVCSRCFGVYFGLLFGVVVYPLWRGVDETEPIPRIWLIASLIPITVDWSLTIFGVWENTHLSRFVTGMILGVACATFIMPALVDIVRNLSRIPPKVG